MSGLFYFLQIFVLKFMRKYDNKHNLVVKSFNCKYRLWCDMFLKQKGSYFAS